MAVSLRRLWQRLAPRHRRVTALIRTGNLARDRQDWPAAAVAYGAALALDARRMPIHIQRGHVLKACGDHAGALAAYRAAWELAPESADAALHFGHLLGQRGDRLQGPTLLRAAATRNEDPRFPSAIAELERLGFNEAWQAAEAALTRGDRNRGQARPQEIGRGQRWRRPGPDLYTGGS